MSGGMDNGHDGPFGHSMRERDAIKPLVPAPVRIQRKRSKGWTMPPNTIYVGRPGRWGNPFYVVKYRDLDTCMALFRTSVQGVWDPSNVVHLSDAWARNSYDLHHDWMRRLCGHPIERARAELRGKNLACWCPLDQPCHADVLLELANK